MPQISNTGLSETRVKAILGILARARSRRQGLFWRLLRFLPPFAACEKDIPAPIKITPALASLLSETLANKDLAKRGQLLARDHLLAFPHFASFKLPDNPDWSADPFQNRSWRWQLNYLAFIAQLVAWHGQSGDDSALTMALRLIASWQDSWLRAQPRDGFEFAWHDHGVALRVEQILLFLAYIEKHVSDWRSKNGAQLSFLYELLHYHGQMLAHEDFFSCNSNHGIEQSRVLLLLSGALQTRASGKWKRLALHRLAGEYDAAFTIEGAHKENSPAYHVQVLNIFMRLNRDYQGDMASMASKLDPCFKKNLEFLAHILNPAGVFPILGDSEQRAPILPYAEDWAGCEEYGHYAYARSRGRKGTKPDQNILFLPASGYAIVRNAWQDAANWNKTWQMIIKGGALSHWHYHRDEGSLILWAFGEDWLIDSGLYSHNKQDDIRKYMRSGLAHNIPEVPDAIIKKDRASLFAGWQMREKRTEKAYELDILLRIHENMEHARHIRINLADFSFNVTDTFHFTDNAQHALFLNWHVPGDKKTRICGNTVRIAGQRHVLELAATGAEKVSIVKGSQNGERSLVSRLRYKLEDSAGIRAAYRVASGASIVTSFAFSERQLQ